MNCNVEVVIRNDATFRAVIKGPDGPFEPKLQPTNGSTWDTRLHSEEMRELQAAILAAYKKQRGEADGA